MARDIVLHGVHIGEHSFIPEKIIDEIEERVIKPGFNFVTLRTGFEQVPQHYFIEWAEYLAKHGVYFVFLYTIQHAPEGRECQFDPETVAKMREVAGEYFLGEMLGEVGSSFACKFAGYYDREEVGWDTFVTLENHDDMESAANGYVRAAKKVVGIAQRLNMPHIVAVEATGLNKYNIEAGVTLPVLEMMCGKPDELVSSIRGVARAFDKDLWGTYIAHEWYGGYRHEDTLKRKRLTVAYKYAYMAGSKILCLESGDECIESFGVRMEKDSVVCQDYNRILAEMNEIIKRDDRPVGGPKVKVGFVSGRHDAYGGWGGSSIWNQFHKKEWGHNTPEHSWRLMEELGTKRQWHDINNYGDEDLSAYPAYGMYDVVPVEADVDKLCKYDYLIFVGWNTMTDEIMDKLTAYVERGGRLLISMAHMSYNPVRGGELKLPSNDKLEKLFGAKWTGEIVNTNGGTKFGHEALDKTMLYPGTRDYATDPIFSAGYANYAKMEITTGTRTGLISESFENDPSDLACVIENKLGKGYATLITATDYPGHPAVYPLFRAVAREFVTSSARNCDVKVIAGDKLRYSVYEGDKVYLLNTDFDLPISVIVKKGDKTVTETLEPMELKWINL